MTQEAAREIFIKRLEEDLMGPSGGNDEIFTRNGGPEFNYFSGKLYPIQQDFTEEESEDTVSQFGGKDTAHCLLEDTTIKKKKISSMGISFLINPQLKEEYDIKIKFGIYEKKSEKEGKKSKKFWVRFNFQESIKVKSNFFTGNSNQALKTNIFKILLDQFPNLFPKSENLPEIHMKCRSVDKNVSSVSLFLVNRSDEILFQTGMSVHSENGSFLNLTQNQESLYTRDLPKYHSIGHTVSTEEHKNDKGVVTEISTSWIPKYFHSDVDPNGHHTIQQIDFYAEDLSRMENNNIIDKFLELRNAYDNWLNQQKENVSTDLQKNRYEEIKKIIQRFDKSIDYLKNDQATLDAFKLANETIMLSAGFKMPGVKYKWRPFQIGFFLLSIESTLNSSSEHRAEVDLLWFPTGGGKTEAYLLLTATLMFYRKLKNGGLDSKDHLVMFTRYTLRALTVDQFNRLATMVICAEVIRKKVLGLTAETQAINPFSIGLWVGSASTPNFIKSTVGNNADLRWTNIFNKCPCCGSGMKWQKISKNWVLRHEEDNKDCVINARLIEMPIMVIDEQIYNNPPSVLIGTIDKFVQIFRKPADIKKLFGDGENKRGPDLIIQDELHLISGPLGSMTGAIEHLIEDYAEYPKIIASTATIQRAEEQINGLYGKKSQLFPLNMSSPIDSFFSVPKKDSTGRKYIGLTSATANSGNYLLQAVAAILLQSINDTKLTNLAKSNVDYIDPYTTPVFYFNSLRELGAADVILQDDAISSMSAYSKIRDEDQRKGLEFVELSSNVSSEEITDIRSRLESKYKENNHISALLSTVMISVGLDVSRLGLMVIVGQPKSISEYIQASSRVGRGNIPGLVITLFNEFKPRDKAFYESFCSWNQDMYSHVETSGVTPFAARARQKILPALLVGFAIKELKKYDAADYGINDEEEQIIIERVFPKILERIGKIDNVAKEAEEELREILFSWKQRNRIPHFWNDKYELDSLLISSEAAVVSPIDRTEIGNYAFASPNSARSVEPGVKIKGMKVLAENMLS